MRVKDTPSLIGKAFYRGKNYNDPYNDITDKVGLRFVVLLGNEILEIDKIIQCHEKWNCSKDRDFEQERLDTPLAFDYQSMHYILKANQMIDCGNGIIIPVGTPCEVQVRTLLQHAYSQLSHSRIYKPSFDPTAQIKRVVAKSMALLEATDEYFEEVDKKMSEIAAYNLLDALTNKLKETMEIDIISSEKVNLLILDTFCSELDFDSFDISVVDEYTDVVKKQYNETFLNSQPIIFLLYYMACNKKLQLIDKWPLSKKELRPIFNQLGIAINDLS